MRILSPSKVATLELAKFQLTAESIDVLEEVMESPDPLGALWYRSIHGLDHEHQPSQPSVWSDGRAITVAKGTILKPLGYPPPVRFIGGVSSVPAPCDWAGTLVYDDGSSRTIDVLLPGFGLCRVDRDSIPNKKQKSTKDGTSVTTQLATATTTPLLPSHLIHITELVLDLRPGKKDRDVIRAMPFVDTLLTLVGGFLTGLSLHADDVDDVALDKFLRLCPKLRALRLDGLTLETLDPLVRAYHDRHATIASLDLIDIKALQVGEWEYFLSHLDATDDVDDGHDEDDPIRTTLKKLRFGKGWSRCCRRETVIMMQQILASPTCQLSYVHMHSNTDSDGPRCSFHGLHYYRGRSVATQPLEIEARVAFLSVLHHTNRMAGDTTATLSQSVVSRIFGFAAPATTRVVIEDMDYDMYPCWWDRDD